MLRNIQKLPRGQRLLIFLLLFVGGLLLLLVLTALLALGALNTAPRGLAAPLLAGVTVSEFAVLPGDDAYPASVVVDEAGFVYAASYQNGAVWRIAPDGTVTELPGSRDGIGAAAGTALLADGTLLVVDHLDPDVRTSGGDVKRIAPDGTVSVFATIPDEQGFVLPYDIAVDGAGRVYVSDRGRDQIWRFEPDGGGAAAWWQSPTADGTVQPEPTGLAYDAANAAIIAADASLNRLYRIAISDGSTAVLYQHDSRFEPPGFDGLTVTPDGTIYVAALSLNRVARLDGDSLTYLAEGFRGISDVAYAAPNRLIAANADRFSLAIPAVGPQLPFALDVVTIGEPG